jgi:hypothetical protein
MGSPYDDTLMSILMQHKGELEFLNTIFAFIQVRPTAAQCKATVTVPTSISVCSVQACSHSGGPSTFTRTTKTPALTL